MSDQLKRVCSMMQRPPHPVIQVEALLWELEERGVDPEVIARYVRLSIDRTRVAEMRLVDPACRRSGRRADATDGPLIPVVELRGIEPLTS